MLGHYGESGAVEHSFAVELREGENAYLVTISFPTRTEEVLLVREREMKTITTILNYNRHPYKVEPFS